MPNDYDRRRFLEFAKTPVEKRQIEAWSALNSIFVRHRSSSALTEIKLFGKNKLSVDGKEISVDPERLYASVIEGLRKKSSGVKKRNFSLEVLFRASDAYAASLPPQSAELVDLLVSWSAIAKPYEEGLNIWGATSDAREYEKFQLDRFAPFSNPDNRKCPNKDEFKEQVFRSKVFQPPPSDIAISQDFRIKRSETDVVLKGKKSAIEMKIGKQTFVAKFSESEASNAFQECEKETEEALKVLGGDNAIARKKLGSALRTEKFCRLAGSVGPVCSPDHGYINDFYNLYQQPQKGRFFEDRDRRIADLLSRTCGKQKIRIGGALSFHECKNGDCTKLFQVPADAEAMPHIRNAATAAIIMLKICQDPDTRSAFLLKTNTMSIDKMKKSGTKQ